MLYNTHTYANGNTIPIVRAPSREIDEASKKGGIIFISSDDIFIYNLMLVYFRYLYLEVLNSHIRIYHTCSAHSMQFSQHLCGKFE